MHFILSIYRYYQLLNGSLLVPNVKLYDSGKFRCIAENSFITKSQRNSTITVKVLPKNNTILQVPNRLWLPLQSSPIYVKSGGKLRLLCISTSNLSDVRQTQLNYGYYKNSIVFLDLLDI